MAWDIQAPAEDTNLCVGEDTNLLQFFGRVGFKLCLRRISITLRYHLRRPASVAYVSRGKNAPIFYIPDREALQAVSKGPQYC